MARPALRMDAVLIQAVIAGALSFAHLHDLAAAAGQDGWKAWAYPISVDLLLVAAWRRLRTDGPSRLAWCWFLIALVASLGANIATAGLLDLNDVPAWLCILVAAWPALAFMGGTLLAHAPGDRMSDPPAHPAPAEKPVPESESVPVVDDAPALPAAEPAPAPVAPAPAVPAALVDHARKVAADHHARTGSPIDTDTLRTRLGVPPHLADAIAAQLAWPARRTDMPARDHFHSLMRIGPVNIGTHRDRNGQTKHAAVCTADDCGWSADYSSQSAAQLAARTHRCKVR